MPAMVRRFLCRLGAIVGLPASFGRRVPDVDLDAAAVVIEDLHSLLVESRGKRTGRQQRLSLFCLPYLLIFPNRSL